MLPGAKGFRRGYIGYIHIYGHTDIQIEICSNSKVKLLNYNAVKCVLLLFRATKIKKIALLYNVPISRIFYRRGATKTFQNKSATHAPHVGEQLAHLSKGSQFTVITTTT